MRWRRLLRSLLPPRRGVILALGGGGARGLAHIGVLAVLEEERIPVTGVAGTSAGAVVGAMWLAHGSAAAVAARFREFLASDVSGAIPALPLPEREPNHDNLLLHVARKLKRGAALVRALDRHALVEAADLDRALAFLLPDDLRIQDLRRPFCAVAVDYTTGAPVALRKGSLRAAIAASSAVPGVVAPYRVEGRALVDGGVVADVPIRQARALGSRPVVAVAAGEALSEDDPDGLTVPRALLRAEIMTHDALRRELLPEADLVLVPEVGDLHWSQFRRLDDAMAAGRRAAQAELRALRALTRQRRTASTGERPAQPR